MSRTPKRPRGRPSVVPPHLMKGVQLDGLSRAGYLSQPAALKFLNEHGGARDFVHWRVSAMYGRFKAEGARHEEAISQVADTVHRSVEWVRQALAHGAAGLADEVALEYRHWRTAQPGADRSKVEKMLAMLKPEARAKARAEMRTAPRAALSIDEALLKVIRTRGYGDGKVDKFGRVAGLEALKRALRKHGIDEVRLTTLKPKRESRQI